MSRRRLHRRAGLEQHGRLRLELCEEASEGQAPSTSVMGYYNGSDLPVYDHLAREFCVCDRWFSSVPGATWPNRLYAVAGRAAGSKDPQRVPIYDMPSFVRHLERQQGLLALVFPRRRHAPLQR